MIRRFLYLLFIIIPSISTAQSTIDDPQVAFQKANKFYLDGKYQDAISTYEQLLDANWTAPGIHYNLGSSYLQLDQLGKAILHLERAFIQTPKEEDVIHNLALAKSKLKDDISEIPQFFLLRWWRQLALMASATFWAILGLVLLFLGACNLILWMKGKTREQRKRGFLIGLPVFLLGLLPVLLALHRVNIEEASPFAILQPEEVTLKAAPDKDSAAIFDLHEGTKVEILDQIGEWYKVRLLNGDQGWLPMEVIERI